MLDNTERNGKHNNPERIPAATVELVKYLSTLPVTETQPIPRAIQKALLETYSIPQLISLVVHSREVQRLGFGTVTIIFKKSIARLLETTLSDEL